MKKTALSATLILAFILYGLQQRQEGERAMVSIPKLSTTVSTTPETTATPSPSPTLTPQPSDTPTTLPTFSPEPTSTPISTPTPTPTGQYRNGSYTGSVTDAFYGNIQVRAIIQGGKLTAVNFLQYPNDRSTSREINSQAMPYLQQEAIQAQSASVDIISGATDTSQAFIQSLTDALSQAS